MESPRHFVWTAVGKDLQDLGDFWDLRRPASPRSQESQRSALLKQSNSTSRMNTKTAANDCSASKPGRNTKQPELSSANCHATARSDDEIFTIRSSDGRVRPMFA